MAEQAGLKEMRRAYRGTAASGDNFNIGARMALLAYCVKHAEGYAIDKCPQQVAIYGKATGGGATWMWHAAFILALFYTIIVFFLGCRCGGWWREIKPRRKGVNKCVQSQVTYKWGWQSPRFVPLGGISQGAQAAD